MNVPQLRFDGFDGEWKEVKVGDILVILKSGLSRKLSSQNIGIPVIRSTNMVNGRLDLSDLSYWYRKDNQGANLNNYILNYGDILINFINSQAQIGKSCLYNSDLEAIYTTNIFRVKTNEKKSVDTFFYYWTLTERYKNEIKNIVKPAVNQASFTTKEFSEIPYYLPPLNEQERISSFLVLLDKKIEKQQEKIEKLEQFKKGMMQKIFSQELRFKDENGGEFGEWKFQSLDELGSFHKGSGLSKSHLTPTGQPCILYGELYTKYSSVITKVYSYCNPKSKAFLGRVNDVLIPSSGETAWDIACASALNVSDVILGGDLNVFRPNQQVNGNFISYQINTIKKYELSNLAQGASVVHLYSTSLKKLKVLVPVYKEQQKISDYLLKLDMKIEKEKEKLMVLEEQKKGFMQAMFL